MSKRSKKNGSVYVCHTYYHVYVTLLKELNKPREERGNVISGIITVLKRIQPVLHRMIRNMLPIQVIADGIDIAKYVNILILCKILLTWR